MHLRIFLKAALVVLTLLVQEHEQAQTIDFSLELGCGLLKADKLRTETCAGNNNDPQIHMLEDRLIYCAESRSFQITYKQLNRVYRGLFPTVDVYKASTGLPILGEAYNATESGDPKKREGCSHSGQGDRDECCETCRGIVPYNVTQKHREQDNVSRNPCHILQLFTVGCCGNGPHTKRCKYCQQQKSVTYLFAYNYKTNKFGFFPFEIPTYCSCKSSDCKQNLV
ncbi:uncharacterized protein LOC128240488 [Mya arenaria]|uniref:uncharacterized protein LOC128240488 n=1 Tax=Mya arenaria TaxID=6604 RepID=UPI0022E25700|nr:uncharacterized protein LOC128240488 [Mya arenaria]